MANGCPGLSRPCAELAEMIVRDGEGATKLVRAGAVCRRCCGSAPGCLRGGPFAVGQTALFASDPNSGAYPGGSRQGRRHRTRRRQYPHLAGDAIVSGGGRDPGYTEEAGKAVMKQRTSKSASTSPGAIPRSRC